MLDKAVPYLNKTFVSVYKVVGFVILGAIVGGMVFYLSTTGFYLFNTSWVIPSILTPDHDRVVQARFRYLEYYHQLQKLEAELLEVQRQQEHLAFAESLHRGFQENFTRALLTDKERAGKDLSRLRHLLENYKNTHRRQAPGVGAGNNDDMTRLLQAQLDQGLIDRDEYLRSQQNLNQWLASQFIQQEKVAELEHKADSLSRSIASLQQMEKIAGDDQRRGILALAQQKTTDVENLLKQQPLVDSALAGSEISVKQAVLKKRASYLAEIVASYRTTLQKLDESPYIRASHNQVNMAFIPYANLTRVGPKTRIIGCYLEFIFCKNIGTVERVLDGEVTARHPLNGRELRGQMVEIAVSDNQWTKSRTLLTRRPPFLL